MQAPFDPVPRAFERLQQAAKTAPSPSVAERDDRLERLERLLVAHREDFVRCISEDFGVRPRAETLSADLLLTLDGVRYARRHLRSWMKRRPAPPHPVFLPSRAFVEPRPRGVVGVIAPWNYPVNLALGPLGAALAAGNRVLVKPSELTPKTAALIAETIAERFSADEVGVVTGGAEVARSITALPLDALVFTGSTAVGRLVARAAAENLTPVTLELGGKSPALVHSSFNLDLAAERIIAGKLFNGGQTCIAPDYALVARGSEARFVSELKKAVARGYPQLQGLSSIIHEGALHRLQGIVEDARSKGARVELLGDPSPGGRVMTPVALLDVTEDMLAMKEEIFGPVLPIETFESLDSAISRIAARPHPLAFYYFDEDEGRICDVLARVTSGGACINDTLVHFAQEELPFGGTGASGMGAYHGEAGFRTFSHERGVLVSSPLAPAAKLLAPPYGAAVDKAIELFVGKLGRWLS